MINYGFTKKLDIPYDTAVELMIEALNKEGFCALTGIDIKEKIKKKLGLRMRKYIIMGAYHSSNANKAILPEEKIDPILPCNVIVYEKDSKTMLSVYDRRLLCR